ncbi:MAG: hypothetical protein IBX63_03535 [Coriobacteriia bacterium]|nr:hypothetical protein [Coriobacteriia bacterium]
MDLNHARLPFRHTRVARVVMIAPLAANVEVTVDKVDKVTVDRHPGRTMVSRT